jgi:ABC-type transport system substrate-binding protein
VFNALKLRALRQGVKFHNGDPFTATDVKFSLERTYDPSVKTTVFTVFTTIDRIEAPDPSTLLIHTKKPDPLLPARLAFYGGQIVPKKYLESVGNDAFNAKPVGTGPTRFASWIKDDRLTLEANADYWGGKPDFDRLIVRSIPETAPRVAALLKRRGGHHHPAAAGSGGPHQGQCLHAGGGSALRGLVRPGSEQLAAAARQPAGQAGAVAGHRPGRDRQTLGDPDGMMWRLLSPGGVYDYWRDAKFDELDTAARFSVDEKFRADAYQGMTKVFLENLPWLPVIQLYEDYGLQKSVEFTPNPNQQFEVRRFNFKFRRA